MFNWHIDKIAQLGKFHNRIITPIDIFLAHAEDGAIEEDIFTAG
jgi:hypothetical protein